MNRSIQKEGDIMGRRINNKKGMRTKTPYVYKGRHAGTEPSPRLGFRKSGRSRRNMTPREAAWAIVVIIIACITVAFVGLKIGTSNSRSQSQQSATSSSSVGKQSSSAGSKSSKIKQKKSKNREAGDYTSGAESSKGENLSGSNNSSAQASSAVTLSNREVDDHLAQELSEIKAAANQYHQNNNEQELDERLDTIENKNE